VAEFAVCIVPGCNRTPRTQAGLRCPSCEQYLRRHGYDRPLELIEKQQARDAAGIKQPVATSKAQAEIVAKMARSELEKRRMLGELPVSAPVDPGEEIITSIRQSRGNVDYYRLRVLELQEAGEEIYVAMIAGVGGKDFETYYTGEAKPHILVTMWDAERDRHTGLCATAVKLGLEVRRIELAEKVADDLYTKFGALITSAAFTEEQKEALRLFLWDLLGRGDDDNLGAGAIEVRSTSQSDAAPIPGKAR
jgi:hypothetical protein